MFQLTVFQKSKMIQKEDRILIGVSGGPDSLSLLKLLNESFVHITNENSLLPVHIDLGFQQSKPTNTEHLKSHFEDIGIDYRIVNTDISKHALLPTRTKNPCFICSMYRRRKIYEIAHEEKCNKIAYGHHKDDIIETLLMNILFGRKIETMYPVQEIFKGSMHIIRPFAYVDEYLLKQLAMESDLPQLPRLCPEDGKTRRQNNGYDWVSL